MGWAYVGGGTNASGTSNVNNLSVVLPTWSAGLVGTILVLTEIATNAATATTPGGFTSRGDFIANSSSRMYLYSKSMADSDSGASVSCAWSASNRIVNAAVVISGAVWDTSTNAGATSGSSISVPALTAGGSPGVTVAFFGGRTGTGTFPTITSFPSSYGNTQQAVSGSTGSRNVLVGSATLASASTSIAATTATASESLNSRAAWTVSLLDIASSTQRIGWGIVR